MKFREARERAGMSVMDAAYKLGVSVPTIYYWEAGTYTPEAKRLSDIAKLYRCSTDYLLGMDTRQDSA